MSRAGTFVADGDMVTPVREDDRSGRAMNWNFSAWSIRNPIPPILLFIVLFTLGVMSFMSLPVTRFPNIDLPIVSVVVRDPGVAPSELETQVTKRVEDAVANIAGVKNVFSNVTEGNSQTLVEFRLEVDTQTAVSDVKDAIERIRSNLPATADAPVVNRVDVEGQAILTYAVSAPAMTLEELSWFVDDTVIRKLQGLKGVARVDRYGGVTREIKVELEPDRLNALGVMASDVNRALRAANADMTGGSGEFADRDQTIRTLGGAKSIDDLKQLEIPLGGGRKVRSVGHRHGHRRLGEPKSFARVNNQTVVSFGIFRGKGESDVEVNERAVAAIADLQAANPGVTIAKVDDSVTFTEGNYDSAMETLVEGAVLSVIVVFLFLRDFRATLVAAAALPLSIIPTFWALDMMGFSLNLVSLLGITLVVGILVDDAIVEIENIVRHVKMGKSPYRASLEAADEIGLAVIAISATIMAVFAPVSFMGGIAGQYFKQFGLTVAVAVFFSLLVARLITPMMAAYFLRAGGHDEPKPGMDHARLRAVLRVTLRFRWITLLSGVAFFAASIYAIGFLPSGFIPREDASRIVFSLELPPGSRLDGHARGHRRGDPRIREVPEVENVYVIGGSNPTGDAGAAPRHRRRRPDAQVGARDRPGRDRGDPAAQARGRARPARLLRQRRADSARSSSASWAPTARCSTSRRARSRAPWRRAACSAASPRTPRSTGPRLPSFPTSTAWPNSASRRRRSPRRCASPRSATSTQGSPSSPSATARSRSACSSTRPRATTSPWSRPAGADRLGRLGAAVVGGRDPLRARPVVDPALQPRAPRRHRRRHGARRRAQRRARPRLGAAGGQEPAGRRAHPGDRRRRDHGRGVRRLRHGHDHRPDAGAGGADPAVRLGLPLLHHPRLAAPGSGRRGCRPDVTLPMARSRCRSSSAS